MLCRIACFRFAFLFELLAIASTAWTAEPAAAPADAQKESPAQRIERALDAKVDIEFGEDATLGDVLKFLEKQGLPAKLDAKALVEANIGIDSNIGDRAHRTLRLKGVSLRSGLRWLLDDADIKAIIRNGTLLITTKDVAEMATEARVYPVLDLLTNPDTNVADLTTYDFRGLKNVLESIVFPDSWTAAGGMGSIEPVPVTGALVITQTQEAHAEIADVLAMLRRVRDQPVAGGKLKPLDQRSWQPAMTQGTAAPKIRRALAERKNIDLQNVPLHEAAQQIAKLWDIAVVVDGAGDATNALVTVHEKDWLLETGLGRLCAELDVDWIVRDEVLWISEPDWLEDKKSVRIYPVSDLVKQPRDEEELIDSLRNTIKPDHWIASGGSGNIEYLANVAALVVLQSDKVHQELQTLLTQLRQVRDKQFPQKAEPQAEDPKNPPLYRKIYQVSLLARPNQAGGGYFSVQDETPKQTQPPLAQFGGMGAAPVAQPDAPVACKPDTSTPADPSADLVKVIPQIIEPSSWKEAGGKGVIQALPGRLVVLQTSRVHQKIARFLQELQ